MSSSRTLNDSSTSFSIRVDVDDVATNFFFMYRSGGGGESGENKVLAATHLRSAADLAATAELAVSPTR